MNCMALHCHSSCLGCFRMHSRMRSRGQQDGDLTLSFNTRLRLLSPFHTAGSSCVFPVWCWSFWRYEKLVLAFRPGSNEPSSNLGNLWSAVWKKSSISHCVDLPGTNLWEAEIFSVSMAILQPVGRARVGPDAGTGDKQAEWDEKQKAEPGGSRSTLEAPCGLSMNFTNEYAATQLWHPPWASLARSLHHRCPPCLLHWGSTAKQEPEWHDNVPA